MFINFILIHYIKMRYPLDELIDKRSIIQLKIERIPDRKTELSEEYEDYTSAILEYEKENIASSTDVVEWHEELYKINGQMWDLEADIRVGKEGELGLEEVGKRALAIRNLNSERILVKRDIVARTGIGYKDVKDNHASQQPYLQ